MQVGNRMDLTVGGVAGLLPRSFSDFLVEPGLLEPWVADAEKLPGDNPAGGRTRGPTPRVAGRHPFEEGPW